MRSISLLLACAACNPPDVEDDVLPDHPTGVTVGIPPLEFYERAPTNVIFLSIDTFRKDHLGVYGNLKNATPFLDSIARDGVTLDDHTLSHNSWFNDTQAKTDRTAMQAWQLEMFAAFAQKLADTTDMDGNDMLSNTICVFTSEFGEGNLHMAFGTEGVPIGIAGGENLGIRQGEHRAVGDQSHANVWLGLLNYLGVDQATFGSFGTAPLDLSS